MRVITICMGSSCFSRGNQENLRAIHKFLTTRRHAARVELVGHLCEGECSEGPNVAIDGVMHHRVCEETLAELLAEAFGPAGETQ